MLRAITVAAIVIAGMITSPARAECTIDGLPILNPPQLPIDVIATEAACLISESKVLGTACFPKKKRWKSAIGNEFCDMDDHERDLQAIHPKLGYLICSITWERTTNTQDIFCTANVFMTGP